MGLGACSASTAGGRSNYIFPTTERTLAEGSSPSLFNGRVSLPPAAVLDSRQQSLPTVYVMGTVHHPLASSCSTFIVGNSFHAVWHANQGPQSMQSMSISLDNSPPGQEDVEAQGTTSSRQGSSLRKWAPLGCVMLLTIYLCLSPVLRGQSVSIPSGIP